MAPAVVIGICGGTGSGKTTLAHRISNELTSSVALLLQQDHYYKDLPQHHSTHELAHHNFDHPDALDMALFAEHVRTLRAGKAIHRPVYEFSHHRRQSETVVVEPRAAVIVEGILIFENAVLRELMDVRIFVDTDADIRFTRRLMRDLRERGRSAESVIHQYLTTVRPMHLKYVEPCKQYADVIITEGALNDAGVASVMREIRTAMGEKRSTAASGA
jgi:uridine kinase